jgi:16S rRNA (cytidine1402-2'-O)-methyltransferase
MRRLTELATEPRTMVFFEAPHRTAATLSAMSQAFGADRLAAVCRELTKTYEEIRRGPLRELADWANSEVRGEVTLVVGGASKGPTDLEAAAEEAISLASNGMKLRAAAGHAAQRHGVAKNDVYELALKTHHARRR